jgi:hypothetical protein
MPKLSAHGWDWYSKTCLCAMKSEVIFRIVGNPETDSGRIYNGSMANLTLVYGLRLLPSEEVTEVGDATLKLKSGKEARVTMHMLEGSKEEIEKQLKTSLDAFFDFYPEI